MQFSYIVNVAFLATATSRCIVSNKKSALFYSDTKCVSIKIKILALSILLRKAEEKPYNYIKSIIVIYVKYL